MSRPSLRLVAALAALAGASGLAAEDQAAPPDTTQLLQRLKALEQQVSGLQTQVQQGTAATQALGASVGKLQNENAVDNSFAWGGLLDVNAVVQHRSSDPAVSRDAGRTVNITFAPILTYSWRDQWLAVAELQGTTSGITVSQGFISNTALDHVVISAGLMPLPFAAYSERFSPGWINKCGESKPAPYDSAFGLFTSDIGDYQIQARGDADLGDNRKLNWHAFLAQGASYASGGDGVDDRLTFGSVTGPSHYAPTIGGRIGFLPQPGIEVGLSAMRGGITYTSATPLTNPATGLPYGPDDKRRFAAYALDGEWRVAGCILRGEWIRLRYDASDDSKMHAQSGYLQASKRLREFKGPWANVEPVVRVGHLDRNRPLNVISGNNEYEHVNTYGLGVNYYHTSHIRSSLFADGYNGEAHNLSQLVLNTTFAF